MARKLGSTSVSTHIGRSFSMYAITRSFRGATLRALLIGTILDLSAAGFVAYGQTQPSSEPILRVETGTHTAHIHRAAVDAAGRLLATASWDKTLRLWSVETGNLVRILRPPIGEGHEGSLYAVAMSPDGKWIATGGYTGVQWNKTHTVYVFETESGRLVKRITGLPRVIDSLAWSPDGRFVAVGLAGDGGLSVFRTDDWQEATRDSEYSDLINNIAFDKTGRLAAVSADGYVRLYNSGLTRIAKVKAPNGERPEAVAFSPDGDRLAIGYGDTNKVDILSAADLRPLPSPDMGKVASGVRFFAVAWTKDGALLAGGTYQARDGARVILRWPDGGGTPQLLPTAHNSLLAIVPLADGSFVYANADPALGRYDAKQQRILERLPEIADLRGQTEKMRIAPDASVIGFGLEENARRPVSFSVGARRLEEGEARGDLATAEIEGVQVTDWKNRYDPKLDGKPLKLGQYEMSRSLAIAPGHEAFLLGADFTFRRFDASGKQAWSRSAPAVAWAVDLSRDGRLAVVAFGDGTIRWYRYSDGKELLALFVHKDGKRWVLWTPEGYYDASPGAEDLIGWHVNRGLEHAADFFPASRFRDRFYKPEVVSAVLRTLDIETALKESGAKDTGPITAAALPPVVKILSPQEGAVAAGSPVQVRYSVRSPSGERVTAIEIRVDGRPLPGGQGVVALPNGPASPEAEQEGTLSVPIEKDATITLVAKAGERSSEAANIRVSLKPSVASVAAAAAAATVPKPKLYVLAVGISRYKDQNLQLRYAAKDATDVAAAWATQQGGLYREVTTRILRDEQATREAVLDGLDWIERETTARDVALVLLSGHGENDADGAYYFLPYDVDADRLRRTGVPDIEIRRSLSHVAGKALFFFDTCHSGSVMSGRKAAPTDINGFVSELASAENGLVVFAASTGREFAQERDEWKNGAFSKALIEALSGKAEQLPGQGVITISALEYWLAERVKTLTGGQQHPTTAKPTTIRDFPIAVAGAR
jgi:WD40 repeat protein